MDLLNHRVGALQHLPSAVGLDVPRHVVSHGFQYSASRNQNEQKSSILKPGEETLAHDVERVREFCVAKNADGKIEQCKKDAIVLRVFSPPYLPPSLFS